MHGATIVEVNILNDGRPDFWKNPFNGPVRTRDQVLALGAQRSILDALGVADHHEPYSVQASVGVERQFGTTMAVSADFVAVEGRGGGGFGLFTRNINLGYNPATGANYPYTDASHEPYPTWGPVAQEVYGIKDSLRSFDVAWQKRMGHRWQGSATYTLSGLWDWVPPPDVGFPLASDFGGERTLSILDQRHRAVFNGIWVKRSRSPPPVTGPASASPRPTAETCVSWGRRAPIGCVRMAPSYRATTSWGTLSIEWTSGSSGGSTLDARRSMGCWRLSTCSTTRTTEAT